MVLLLRGREAHGRSVEQKRLCREMGSCRRRKDSQFVQSRFANSCTTCKDSRFSKPPCPPYACPALALPLPCPCCGPKKTRSKLNQSQVRVIPTVGILSDINSDILSGILSVCCDILSDSFSLIFVIIFCLTQTFWLSLSNTNHCIFGFVSDILTFYLTNILTFYLEYVLAVYMIFFLPIYLAFYMA